MRKSRCVHQLRSGRSSRVRTPGRRENDLWRIPGKNPGAWSDDKLEAAWIRRSGSFCLWRGDGPIRCGRLCCSYETGSRVQSYALFFWADKFFLPFWIVPPVFYGETSDALPEYTLTDELYINTRPVSMINCFFASLFVDNLRAPGKFS